MPPPLDAGKKFHHAEAKLGERHGFRRRGAAGHLAGNGTGRFD
jgi:hypothetical protein